MHLTFSPCQDIWYADTQPLVVAMYSKRQRAHDYFDQTMCFKERDRITVVTWLLMESLIDLVHQRLLEETTSEVKTTDTRASLLKNCFVFWRWEINAQCMCQTRNEENDKVWCLLTLRNQCSMHLPDQKWWEWQGLALYPTKNLLSHSHNVDNKQFAWICSSSMVQ